MKYALVKNGIIENIIEYDEESLLPDIKRYEDEIAQYNIDKTKYDSDIQNIEDKYISLNAKLSSLYSNAELLQQPLDEENAKVLKLEISNLKYPKAISIPRPAIGKYIPPAGYELIEITNGNYQINSTYAVNTDTTDSSGG